MFKEKCNLPRPLNFTRAKTYFVMDHIKNVYTVISSWVYMCMNRFGAMLDIHVLFLSLWCYLRTLFKFAVLVSYQLTVLCETTSGIAYFTFKFFLSTIRSFYSGSWDIIVKIYIQLKYKISDPANVCYFSYEHFHCFLNAFPM